jgi:adenosylcobinamide-GDP ribazoletransferase
LPCTSALGQETAVTRFLEGHGCYIDEISALPAITVVVALLIGHSLSRLAATALVWRLKYARVDGKAKPLTQYLSARDFVIAGIVASVPAVVIGGAGYLSWQAILTGLIAVALAAVWLSRWFVRRIGGYTGDCLGAVQQVTEVVLYLSVLAEAANMTVRNSS